MEKPLVEALHLIVLWGLAVAQPIYDLLARHSGFFVVRRSEPADVLVLAGVLSFLLPAAVAGILTIPRWISPRAGRRGVLRPAAVFCHRLAIAVLIAILALQIFKRLAAAALPGWVLIAAAGATGLAGAAAYHRLAAARQFLTLLTPAIAVFPVIFLLDPSVAKIVRPRHVEAISELEFRPEAPAARTPVFLIVFDALPVTSLMNRVGEIDAVRFPSFARLAGSATWYRNATTVSADTIWAVPAILTGNYPDVSLQPSYHDHPRNLFTLLGKSHELVLFEHLTDLCPAELCPRDVVPAARRLRALAADLRVVFLHVLLPEDLTASLPQISHAWGDFAIGDTKPGQRNRSRKFRLFLDAVEARQSPALYFLHSLFPHAPYQYLPSGKRYTRLRQGVGRQAVLRGRWTQDEQAVLAQHRRHLLQVGMVDLLLGHILDRLDQTGLFERSLIVVTADHGVSFRPGDYRRNLTETNFADVMPVPLLVKRPGQTAGAIDDRNVETIDVLPTLADVLGLELPWPVDGVSALASRPERPQKICYGEAATADGRLELAPAAFDAKLDTVARAERAFGGGDLAAVLRAGPHPELLGRPLDSLALDEDADSPFARLADPSLFQRVDPASSFVPALVEGFIEPGSGLEPPLDLAIAVNGTVAATTRTRLEPVGGGLLAFSALTPEIAFGAGTNEVEVLVIRTEDGGSQPRLTTTAQDQRRALHAGMRLGHEPVWGIEEAGFHDPERLADGTTIRWTTGAAKLVVPPVPGAPPTRLQVELAFTGKEGNALAVSVSGHELFRGVLPPGAWSHTFDLQAVPRDGKVVIELESGTFVPKRTLPGSRDARTLGVAVAGIWLEEKADS